MVYNFYYNILYIFFKIILNKNDITFSIVCWQYLFWKLNKLFSLRNKNLDLWPYERLEPVLFLFLETNPWCIISDLGGYRTSES